MNWLFGEAKKVNSSSNFTLSNYSLLFFLVLFANTTSRVEAQKIATAKNWPIITRQGDQLMEGSKVYRFFGLAAPNIQQNESQIQSWRSGYPNIFAFGLYAGRQRNARLHYSTPHLQRRGFPLLRQGYSFKPRIRCAANYTVYCFATIWRNSRGR